MAAPREAPVDRYALLRESERQWITHYGGSQARRERLSRLIHGMPVEALGSEVVDWPRPNQRLRLHPTGEVEVLGGDDAAGRRAAWA